MYDVGCLFIYELCDCVQYKINNVISFKSIKMDKIQDKNLHFYFWFGSHVLQKVVVCSPNLKS